MPPTLCLQVLDNFSDSCTVQPQGLTQGRLLWGPAGDGMGDGQCAKRILGPFSSQGGNLSSHLRGEPKGRRLGLGQKGSMCCRLGLLRLTPDRAPPLVGGLSYSLIKFLSFYFENIPTDTHMQLDLTHALIFLRVEQIKANLTCYRPPKFLYVAPPHIKNKRKKKRRGVFLCHIVIITFNKINNFLLLSNP